MLVRVDALNERLREHDDTFPTSRFLDCDGVTAKIIEELDHPADGLGIDCGVFTRGQHLAQL